MASEIHKISNIDPLGPGGRSRYFEKIYEAYFKRLYAYSRAIVDSQSLAKDIVSDLFYQLWKKETDLSSFDNLEMYLFVSVRNLSIQALKKEGKYESDESLNVKLESIDYIDPEELLIEKELLLVIEQTIDKLPDQCKLIFNFSRNQGLKNGEIAEELGISIVTVKSQLRKAQLKLKAEIVKFYHDKDGSQYPDIRLIGSYFLAIGFEHFDILN